VNIKNNKGFSLIEIMIVITLIGLMTGLVANKVVKSLEEGRLSATKIQINQLGTVLDNFRRLCGFYPTTDQGLQALVRPPTSGRLCKALDADGLIKSVPKDGWNNAFEYTSDGSKYEVKSYGSGGKESGDKVISSNDTE
jgi:general secretion pathway protein G